MRYYQQQTSPITSYPLKMKRNNALLLIICCLTAGIYLAVSTGPKNKTRLLIYGQLNGEIEPCPCGGNQKGGLAKLKTLILSGRKAAKDALVISHGNLLTYTGEKATDSLILKLLPRIGFDACAIGWLEMIEGADYFAINMNPGKINWVSCNLLYRGKPLAPAYRLIKSGAVTIGVTSVVSPLMIQTPLLKGKIEFLTALPAVEKVSETIEALKQMADHVIVLTQLEPALEKTLYGQYKNDPAVIFSRASSAAGRDTSAGNGIGNVYGSGERGRYITALDIGKGKGADRCQAVLIDRKYREDPELKALISRALPARAQPETLNEELLLKKLAGASKRKNGEPFIFYYSPGCPDCRQIMEKYLVKLPENLEFRLVLMDLSIAANYEKLMKMEAKYKTATREVPVALYKDVLYDGKENISTLLDKILGLKKY